MFLLLGPTKTSLALFSHSFPYWFLPVEKARNSLPSFKVEEEGSRAVWTMQTLQNIQEL